ncbi:MAG: RNA ligase [Bacteroidetes bacterium ADurb.Bin408]|nr:MAG: RNA ligase [Bacteroidetes bacterium ADurb.Bin408]
MRKLASIQRIKALEAIPGADAIEKATVLGWQLVVKKGEYQVGDLTVYCEIDSLLPERPEFEFLKARKMRIKTIRLRGQISQGICFPLSILPAGTEIAEGVDCTDILGIKKYEPPLPACLSGKVKGRFPYFLPKTDETRVQVLQNLLDRYKGTPCYITEKIDGSSVTYYLKDGAFGVCSRNLELLEDDTNSLWQLARALDIENKLKSLNTNMALQGEIFGEGIQSNKLKIRGQAIRFFNAYDITKGEYLAYSEFSQLMTTLGLDMVPLITDNYVLENDINLLIKRATVKSLICPEVWAEGIVVRPLSEIMDMTEEGESLINRRVSFKVINPEFLLKFDE